MTAPGAQTWGHSGYARVTLDATRGADWAVPIRQLDATTGLPLSLAGRSWAFAVAAVDGTAAATGTVDHWPTGTLTIRLTAAQTAALTAPEYRWSLTETDASARTSVIAGGTLWVLADPTP